MENGTESDELLVSSIRKGNKREFAFVMKQQMEYAGLLGRKRVTRSQNGVFSNGVSKNSSPKRVKSCKGNKVSKMEAEIPSVENEQMVDVENFVNDEAVMREKGGKVDLVTGEDREKVDLASEEEEPQSDVVDLNSDDERKCTLVESAIREEEPIDVVEKPVCEEETKSNKGLKNENGETQINLGESLSDEDELKDAVVEPMSEDLQLTEDQVKQSNAEEVPIYDNLKIVHVDTPSKEFGILSGQGIEESALVEKHMRRITRSALKSKGEVSEALGSNEVKTEEVAESDVTSSVVNPAKKLEMKMSKKVELTRVPTRLKELLETGFLEGLAVRYIRGSKVRGPSDIGLQGIIKGSGILCFCDTCNGTEVVTPNLFELHAGSGNKRPPEYIYLENGNTLRDVLNSCKNASPDALGVAIQMAIGCLSGETPTFCLNCKGSIPEAGVGKTMLLCDSCLVLKESRPCSTQMCDDSDRSPIAASITKSSAQVSQCGSSRSKGKGRLTRKDLRMHKLVFEERGLPEGTAVAYYARGQKLLEGYKKGFGIFCFCCNSEVSPSQFEAHAGWASRRKPFHNIYTSNGVSLHEYSVSLSKERKFSADENDDLCSICADGGDLLCCDTCPRAFHAVCVSLPTIPQGKWYCRYCLNMFQKEKSVERNANAVAAGRVAGIDALEQLTKRCIRIVETFEAEVGGCMLCRGHDFSKSGFGPRTVILCDQCEKEFHVGCLKEHKMDDLKELPKGKWFCSTDCNKIHSALQKLLADGEEKLPDSLMDVIKKKHEEKGLVGGIGLDIRWRLLCGKMASDETRRLLSKAVSIFHDRFDPIADSTTSRHDLIPNMVYGRNLRDQEFGGMYCAILTVNSAVVSAGIIRIFGSEVAELPLVATNSECQGQGYFQSLFFCIENLLESLNVKSLVLPAADEAECIWTKKFGFEKLTEDQLKQYRRDHQIMVFQGTSMLHKSVSRS
ncbi:unnamed protein product [Ilex paraguariensis]|uniref:PHD-type domain-containing protein n=1 Tax=Ilex paraguariensis TaxID=185542 RepID=A0ABC8UPD6_9AQUA